MDVLPRGLLINPLNLWLVVNDKVTLNRGFIPRNDNAFNPPMAQVLRHEIVLFHGARPWARRVGASYQSYIDASLYHVLHGRNGARKRLQGREEALLCYDLQNFLFHVGRKVVFNFEKLSISHYPLHVFYWLRRRHQLFGEGRVLVEPVDELGVPVH